jgi:hypothetical protein
MFTMVISDLIPYKDHLQTSLNSKSQIVYVGDGGAGDYENGSCYRCAERYIENKYLFTSSFKKCLTHFVGQFLHGIYQIRFRDVLLN